MPKKAKELGPLVVSRLVQPGLHSVGGVAGLALQVTGTGARSWILRVVIAGKRRDMGLGGYPDVTLAGAREAARAARAAIREGRNPILDAREARSRMVADLAAALTFKTVAATYIKSIEPEWRNAKHGDQWRNTLERYAYPVMGEVFVRDIGLAQVKAVLDPIWTTKTETAKRLRGRIEMILDWAITSEYREGPNPARWRGYLDKLYPAPAKIAKHVHHRALPFVEVGRFMQDLRAAHGTGARALEFTILTAARSGDVRGATWAEIDLAKAVWTVPAERMKAKREHRVPLSPAAVALLEAIDRDEAAKPEELVFISNRDGQLSDMTLSAVLKRMKVNAVPHGFRSTFRDWCAERTNYPGDVAEMALAHAIGDKVEAAYRRGDLFEKRRQLMNEWAKYCGKVEERSDGKSTVIPLKRGVA
jgi:integrase